VWSLYDGEWYEGEIESVDGDNKYTVYYHEWNSSYPGQSLSSLQPWVDDVKPSRPERSKCRRSSSERSARERRKSSSRAALSPSKRSTFSASSRTSVRTLDAGLKRGASVKEKARPLRSSLPDRRYYIVFLLARGSESSQLQYFTPLVTGPDELGATQPTEAREMSEAGLAHGKVIDGAFVNGTPWARNSEYLDLGEDCVPVFDAISRTCDVFTDKAREKKLQIKGTVKLLPMKWLAEVSPTELIGCTVVTKWDNATAVEAIVERVNSDGTFCVTQLGDAFHSTVNISIKKILKLKAGVRRRFRVKSPWARADEIGKDWQAHYQTTTDGEHASTILDHGTVDEGIIILGSRVNIGDGEFIDLGEDEVPTGPKLVGKQKIGMRKLLPATCLTLVTAESMVGYRIIGDWRDGNRYPDIVVERAVSSDELSVRRTTIKGFAASGPDGRDDAFHISRVKQMKEKLSKTTTVAESSARKHSFKTVARAVTLASKLKRSVRGSAYDVIFATPSMGLKIAPHISHGLPTVQLNERSARNPNPRVGDVVVAVNGNSLEVNTDPYAELMKLVKEAGRPVTLTFKRDPEGEALSPQASVPPYSSKVGVAVPSDTVVEETRFPPPPLLPPEALNPSLAPPPPSRASPKRASLRRSLLALFEGEHSLESPSAVYDPVTSCAVAFAASHESIRHIEPAEEEAHNRDDNGALKTEDGAVVGEKSNVGEKPAGGVGSSVRSSPISSISTPGKPLDSKAIPPPILPPSVVAVNDIRADYSGVGNFSLNSSPVSSISSATTLHGYGLTSALDEASPELRSIAETEGHLWESPKSSTYEVEFVSTKLGLVIEHDHLNLPIVIKNNGGGALPKEGDWVVAVNSVPLHLHDDPYDEMFDLIQNTGRPLKLTFKPGNSEELELVKELAAAHAEAEEERLRRLEAETELERRDVLLSTELTAAAFVSKVISDSSELLSKIASEKKSTSYARKSAEAPRVFDALLGDVLFDAASYVLKGHLREIDRTAKQLSMESLAAARREIQEDVEAMALSVAQAAVNRTLEVCLSRMARVATVAKKYYQIEEVDAQRWVSARFVRRMLVMAVDLAEAELHSALNPKFTGLKNSAPKGGTNKNRRGSTFTQHAHLLSEIAIESKGVPLTMKLCGGAGEETELANLAAAVGITGVNLFELRNREERLVTDVRNTEEQLGKHQSDWIEDAVTVFHLSGANLAETAERALLSHDLDTAVNAQNECVRDLSANVGLLESKTSICSKAMAKMDTENCRQKADEHINHASLEYEQLRANHRSLAQQAENIATRAAKHARETAREFDINIFTISGNTFQPRYAFAERISRLTDNHLRMIRQSFGHGIDRRVNEALDRADWKTASVEFFCSLRHQKIQEIDLQKRLDMVHTTAHVEATAKHMSSVEDSALEYDGAKEIKIQICYEENARRRQRRELGRNDRYRQRLRFDMCKQDLEFVQQKHVSMYHEAMTRSVPREESIEIKFGDRISAVHQRMLQRESIMSK
jgi:hypothetical protein